MALIEVEDVERTFDHGGQTYLLRLKKLVGD